MSTYQAGYKFRDLKQHIETCVGKAIAQRLQTEMVDMELVLGAKNQGRGMDMFTQLYEAEFYFDRFPFNHYSPAVLFAQFVAWLMDNDEGRSESGVPDPEVAVTMQSDNEAIVVITVPFEEPVQVVEDPNGAITWRGKQWRIDEYPVDTAEHIEVIIS